MLVHIIADYGPAGDLAFAEVVQRLRLYLPDAEPVLTPVPPLVRTSVIARSIGATLPMASPQAQWPSSSVQS